MTNLPSTLRLLLPALPNESTRSSVLKMMRCTGSTGGRSVSFFGLLLESSFKGEKSSLRPPTSSPSLIPLLPAESNAFIFSTCTCNGLGVESALTVAADVSSVSTVLGETG